MTKESYSGEVLGNAIQCNPVSCQLSTTVSECQPISQSAIWSTQGPLLVRNLSARRHVRQIVIIIYGPHSDMSRQCRPNSASLHAGLSVREQCIGRGRTFSLCTMMNAFWLTRTLTNCPAIRFLDFFPHSLKTCAESRGGSESKKLMYHAIFCLLSQAEVFQRTRQNTRRKQRGVNVSASVCLRVSVWEYAFAWVCVRMCVWLSV